MTTVRMEIDTPPSVYAIPDEFTGLLVDRQLHRPLFEEMDQLIRPGLLSLQDRASPFEWAFRVEHDSRWKNGAAISAHDVAARLADVTRSPRWAWTSSLIHSCVVQDARTVIVRTRFEVEMLDRVLVNPIFSPRRDGITSGSYRLFRRGPACSLLRANDGASGPDVELITTDSRDEGRERYMTSELDIGWGIGVPSSFWSSDDTGPFASTSPLDMHAVIVAGRALPMADVEWVLTRCALEADMDCGIERTESRYSIVNRSRPATEARAGRQRWPLYFTDFPPNSEIVTEMAKATNGRLVPRKVAYDDVLKGRSPADGFSLQVHTTCFPDSVGLQVETAPIATGKVASPEWIRELSLHLWGSAAANERRQTAIQMEETLDRLFRRKVIGRIRPRFRTHKALKLPTTGWFDFTQLQ